eukprot:TRINITY_DN17370_c0_g1_i1.p1 TRINITY_DN17370_c0_g1~~TRINITY_DN17370_c0_g1_i1.p1  ORF type:complete len:207 (+),score=34.32 TRINITY_DN17370_c0_g1_i1:86-706(+)
MGSQQQFDCRVNVARGVWFAGIGKPSQPTKYIDTSCFASMLLHTPTLTHEQVREFETVCDAIQSATAEGQQVVLCPPPSESSAVLAAAAAVLVRHFAYTPDEAIATVLFVRPQSCVTFGAGLSAWQAVQRSGEESFVVNAAGNVRRVRVSDFDAGLPCESPVATGSWLPPQQIAANQQLETRAASKRASAEKAQRQLLAYSFGVVV